MVFKTEHLRLLSATLALLLLGISSTVLAQVKRVTVMSWNVTNYIDVPGISIFPDRSAPRSPVDQALMRKYFRMAAPGLVAFQEVATPEAGAFLAGADYVSVIEPRYFDESRRSSPNDIFVNVAAKNSVVQLGPVNEIGSLAMEIVENGKPTGFTRAGLYTRVKAGSRDFTFAAVHLKSGCPSTKTFTRPDCLVLRAQAEKLGEWLETQLAAGTKGILIAGDFNRDFVTLGAADAIQAAIRKPVRQRDLPWMLLHQPIGSCSVRDNIYDYFIAVGEVVDMVDPNSIRALSPTSRELDAGARMGDHCPVLVDLIVR
jgi:endonuclease/exonuclease/phosphatase family metal-dependent hydrolase